MAAGDPADMAARMAAVLPGRWFPPLAEAPVLNAVLTGIGQAWSFCFALISFARGQARLATASGAFLDMFAQDHFGAALGRKAAETDGAYRARVAANLLRERATRSAVAAAVGALGGARAAIREPMRPADTGGYAASSDPARGGGGGYGSATLRYGSLDLPYQFFVDVTRPVNGALLLSVAPYASVDAARAGGMVGGYGAGAAEYAPLDVLGDLITDDVIAAAIVAALPVSCTAWVRFS